MTKFRWFIRDSYSDLVNWLRMGYWLCAGYPLKVKHSRY